MGALGRLGGGGDQLDHFNFCPQKSVSLSTTKIQNYEAQNIRLRFSKCIFLKCIFTHFPSFVSLSKRKCYIQFNEDDNEHEDDDDEDDDADEDDDDEDEVGSRVASGEEGKETRDFHLAENPHSSRFVIGMLRMMRIMTDGDDVTITPTMEVQCQISQRHWGRIDDGFEERCPNESADGLNE